MDRTIRIDMGVFVTALLMLGMGVVLVYSSSFAVAQERFGGSDFFLERQAVRAVLALVLFMVFINVDYHRWCRWGAAAFVVAVVLLVLVLMLPASHAVNGARRWLSIGPVSFQISEFACMALIVALAERTARAGQQIQEWKTVIRNLALIGTTSLLVLVEPNFSTALIIAVVGFAVLFMAGSRLRHLFIVCVTVVPLIAAGFLAAPYRRARLSHFLHGSDNTSGIGYQAYQALIGLGNGGLFGVGLGQGKQKLFYLPEPHTDFVFAILGEEIGFAGLLVVLGLFTYLVVRGFRISVRAPDKQGQLLAFGITILIALHVIVHAAVNVGLIPTTGVPLPFLSYGGMSLVFTLSSIGILLNISGQTKRLSAGAVSRQRERLSKYQPRP